MDQTKTMDSVNEEMIKVDKLLTNIYNFYAHRKKSCEDKDEEIKETLAEHVEKSVKYFDFLYRQKNMSSIMEHFIKIFLPEASGESIALFYKMNFNVISFHDMGKINPEFQRIKMKNDTLKKIKISCMDGSRHSILSSAIYYDYFLEEINKSEITQEERYCLHTIMLVNSFIISRHHSDLNGFQEFLSMFMEGGKIYSIFEGFKIEEFKEIYRGPFYERISAFNNFSRKNNKCIKHFFEDKRKDLEISDKKCIDKKLALYTYARYMYSILVSCDYYATTEFENGIEIKDFGDFNEITEIDKLYENSDLQQTIRKFRPNHYVDDTKDINVLRKCMFYEAEENLLKNREQNIFFLEAPTGGGKSNIAMNCSLKLLDEKIKKIFYVYPFNTLVEQNLESLKKVFGSSEIFSKIAVINSITPIKTDRKKEQESSQEEENETYYQQALLDRQFLNYPFILITHVNLFQIMFGNEKEAAISFYQLAGSVIVLDEIQSYKNTIWTEIMMMLETYSSILNFKVIIMSATLPHLDYLTGQSTVCSNLIVNRAKYFEDSRFKDRVKISYELLKADIDTLYEHVLKNASGNKKILMEFIKKKTAEAFFKRMKEEENKVRNENNGKCDYEVFCMTGDDNQIDRERILNRIQAQENGGIILIATQVVEAGVDIDMDFGYKNMSKLDSDEQFLGRINRNFKKKGEAYFFEIDKAEKIYKNDYRVGNIEYTLQNEEMQNILLEKQFASYYELILNDLKSMWNDSRNEKGIEHFVEEEIKMLDFEAVSKRMKLIEDDKWYMSVFIARDIESEKMSLNGRSMWETYKNLLANQELGYAEK